MLLWSLSHTAAAVDSMVFGYCRRFSPGSWDFLCTPYSWFVDSTQDGGPSWWFDSAVKNMRVCWIESTSSDVFE